MNTQIEAVEDSDNGARARMTALRERLMQKVDKHVAPSGIFHWSTLNPYGIAKYDGSPEAPPISLPEFRDLYHELKASALPFAAPMVTLEELELRAEAHRAQGFIPIAIAHFEYTTTRRRYVAAAARHAKEGTPFDVPAGTLSPSELKEAVQSKLAFFASPLLKQEFIGFVPAPIKHYGLHAQFAIPQDCYLSNARATLSGLEIDLDDGKGWQPVPIGGEVLADYATPGTREIYLRARDGNAELAASFRLEVSESTAPKPNDTWRLKSSLPAIDGVQPTGTAWVFLGKGNAHLSAPVLIAEGFPGGYKLDFLWEMLNKENVASDILSSGRDLIIVGFDQGTFYMEGNAGVVIDAIQTGADHVKRGGKAPKLVVGGASMGGVVARYALTYMEANGMEHYAAKYFSIDSPHTGAFVPCSTQLFTNVFKDASDAVATAQKLLQSVASRQLLLGWVNAENTLLYEPNPLRTQFNDNLRNLGWYPKKPEKYGISDGSGKGLGNGSENGAQALWWSEACAGANLFTQPGEAHGDKVLICQLAYKQTSWTDWYVLGADPMPSCEPAPGGTSPTYKVLANALREASHDAKLFQPSNCFIPTISALAMDGLSPSNNAQLYQDISKYFNQDNGGKTWLDKYTFAKGNLEHVALNADLAGWIFGNLTDKTVFVVNDENQVYSLPDGEHYPLQAGARDLAVAGDGTVWVLSQQERQGGYAPFWLNRADKTWHPYAAPGAGTSIGIRPFTSIPYVTNTNGAISALAKDGKVYPIACPDKARDISYGGDFLWIVTSQERAGGFAPAYSVRSTATPIWTTLPEPAAASRIAVLPDGSAMIVNSHGEVASLDIYGRRVAYPGVVAQDIGVASDGTVWVISDIERPGGFAPYWLNWENKEWHALPAPVAAVKIAAL